MARQASEVAQAPKAEAARAHYNRWASAYGRSRLLPSLQKGALAELRPGSSDRFLDVACGAGGAVIDLAPHVERAVGVDLSEGMLEIARSRLASAGTTSLANLDFVQASSDALPFEDGEFTALVCTTALHHFPNPQASISEMARVLAPGGRLVIGDAARDLLVTKLADRLYRRFEAGHVGLQRRREIEAMMTQSGLSVTSSRHVWLRIYALVAAEQPTG